MAKLRIYRSNEWMNRLRAVGVYVDGQKRGIISNDGVDEYSISPGTHTLKTKIDWCGSKDYVFTVSENETKTVMLSSFGYYYHFGLIGVLILVLHFVLQYAFNISVLIWLVIPVCLFILYYMTIGSNSYLIIRERNLSTSPSNKLAEDQSL